MRGLKGVIFFWFGVHDGQQLNVDIEHTYTGMANRIRPLSGRIRGRRSCLTNPFPVLLIEPLPGRKLATQIKKAFKLAQSGRPHGAQEEVFKKPAPTFPEMGRDPCIYTKLITLRFMTEML